MSDIKNIGNVSLTLKDLKVLRNDGLGTEAKFTTRNTNISVKLGEGNLNEEKLEDLEPPEDFTPIITQDPDFFEGGQFIVFATQDKGSGVDRYEVREGIWGGFIEVRSPYILKHQALDKKIFIKAIDKVGNERLVKLPAKNPSRYQKFAIFAIISVITFVCFLLKILWPRFKKQS